MPSTKSNSNSNSASIPPPVNSLVRPLLTDLYQITMAYAYWKARRENEEATFELFFRKNPFGGSYTLYCGLDEVLKFIANFSISKADVDYLKSTPSLAHCEDGFFEYLLQLDCSEVVVSSQQEGSVVFPRTPLLTLSGPLGITQLIETTLLNLVNFPSLVATNALRMVLATKQYDLSDTTTKCIEFGLRRAQSPDGAFSASKYCIVGGFDSTSNVLAGQLLDIPIAGTHAHSFVQSHTSLKDVKGKSMVQTKDQTDSVDLLLHVLEYRTKFNWGHTNDGELAAFVAYAVAFPHACLCLVDTYNTLESGLLNFIMVALALHDIGYTPIGIRLDSGDLATLSKECKRTFDKIASSEKKPFLSSVSIVVSDGINEGLITEMNQKGHAINVFGIGTNLVTCQAQPALGCVYKLVELQGQPRIKLSNAIEKVLFPGTKQLYRIYGNDKKGSAKTSSSSSGVLKPIMDILMEQKEEGPKVGKTIVCCDPYNEQDRINVIPTKVEQLLQVVWDGKKGLVVPMPDLITSKERVQTQIKAMHPEMLHPTKPKPYDVKLSKKLYNDFHALWNSRTSVSK